MLLLTYSDPIRVLPLSETALRLLHENGVWLIWQFIEAPDIAEIRIEVQSLQDQIRRRDGYVLISLRTAWEFWTTGALDIPLVKAGLSPSTVRTLELNGISTATDMLSCPASERLVWRGMTMAKMRTAEKFRQFVPGKPMRTAFLEGKDPLYRPWTYKVLLAAEPDGVMRNSLADFPDVLDPDTVLASMEADHQIRIEGDRIFAEIPTFREYAARLSSTRERTLTLSILGGKTILRGAEDIGTSHQGAAKIIFRVLGRCPPVWEDRYLETFRRYRFTEAEFAAVFQEPPAAYRYLRMRNAWKLGELPLREMLADETVPDTLRHRAATVVFRNTVLLDGSTVPRRKHDIARWCVRQFCQDITGIDDFLSVYERTIAENGLATDRNLMAVARTYENKFADSTFTLTSRHHRIRWYPLEERDFSHLLDVLDLGQYHDVEISALLLYRQHIVEMEAYDIRSEFELHNLIRTLKLRDPSLPVTTGKMPMLRFGSPDRTAQIINMLDRHSPTTTSELALCYERVYGIRHETFSADFTAALAPFSDGKWLRTQEEPLPEEQRNHLCQVLTDDFYTDTDLRKIFLEEYSGEDPAQLNSITLRMMGFRAEDNCAVRSTWPSASRYITTWFARQDYVPCSGHPFAGVGVYHLVVASLRQNLDLISCAPGWYITAKKLTELGVRKGDLVEFRDRAADAVPEGTYFTIATLLETIPGVRLPAGIRRDWFLASVLAEDLTRFRCMWFGETIILRRGTQPVTLGGLCQAQIQDGIPEQKLRQILANRYGINLTKSELAAHLNNTAVFQDPITDRLYSRYSTYQEQVATPPRA